MGSQGGSLQGDNRVALLCPLDAGCGDPIRDTELGFGIWDQENDTRANSPARQRWKQSNTGFDGVQPSFWQWLWRLGNVGIHNCGIKKSYGGARVNIDSAQLRG